MLKAKVSMVLPRPLRILFKVLATYIKGQMKLNVIMKLPASGLLYKSIPAKRPKRRKAVVHRKPNRKQ